MPTETDRAVSDVVGFVLVFALITASVGVVTVAGLGGLQDARNAERINNAERAFEVLADNMRDVSRGGAPSRATEVKLAETTLTIGDSVDMNVTVSDSPETYPAAFRPIVFAAAGDSNAVTHGIVYEGGAVVRVDRDSAVMKRRPGFVFDENRTVIHYTEPKASGTLRRSGTTTVLVRGERGAVRVLASRTVPASETVTMTVETTPRRTEAWERYLESAIDWKANACSAAGDTVTCTFHTDRLSVTTTKISVSLSE
ncbi:MAG: hypothetical protein ABEJ82_09550 [Haloplanus sp.]